MVTMNCTDKLAKKLGFENKTDLAQYFELFPEVHQKVKEIYKKEYEAFYESYTFQALNEVDLSLKRKRMNAGEFSKTNATMIADQTKRWRILIDEREYETPVPREKMAKLEAMANKMNFDSYMDF